MGEANALNNICSVLAIFICHSWMFILLYDYVIYSYRSGDSPNYQFGEQAMLRLRRRVVANGNLLLSRKGFICLHFHYF